MTRTVLVSSLVGGLAMATGAAAAPRGIPFYPFCPANHQADAPFPSGNVSIDTTNGSVNGGPATGILINSDIRVLTFQSISIAAGDVVTVVGAYRLALLSHADFTIAGALVADGASSPDMNFSPIPVPGGPGGGAGGLATAGGTGGGAGGGAQSVDPTNNVAGSGAGGFGGGGGTGGGANNGDPGVGGLSYGDLALALDGGSGGGAGPGAGNVQTTGAGGGGGLFLGSLGALTIAATGTVSANGGNGDTSGSGAAGAGSGGGIVLWGAPIVNDGVVSANGGAGGDGGCCGGSGGGGGGRILIESRNAPHGGAGIHTALGGPAGVSGVGTVPESGADGVVALDPGVFGSCSATQPFVCYKAKPTKGGTPFAKQGVSLEDAFATSLAQITKPAALCNPADTFLRFPEDHFESYRVAPAAKHEKRKGIEVITPLGDLTVDTVKPDRLLVPSAKSLTSAPPALASPHFDAYQCYKAKLSKGEPRLANDLIVEGQDQFSEASRALHVKKLSRLCMPVSVDGAPIQNTNRALTCFSVVPGTGVPKHVKRTGVFLTHLFGTEQVDTVKEEEWCAPSSFPPS